MTTNSSDLTRGLHGDEISETGERTYAAGFERQAQESGGRIGPSRPVRSRFPEMPRILIVTDDDVLAKQLTSVFRQAGLNVERARNMAAGCDSARSGLFHVVVTQPVLADGSWKRLVDTASRHRPGFVVILVARTFDLQQWAQALDEGAFDVLDILHDLPKAAEAAKRALWAAYLEGAELNLEPSKPSRNQ